MFGSVVLDAILGILALFTLLGICITTLTEIIQSFFQKVRAAYLYEALKLLFTGKLKALTDKDLDFFQQVLDHPVIKAMAPPGKRPSYLDPGMLAQVVIDLLLRKDDTTVLDIPLEQLNEALAKGIAQIPSDHLRRALSTLLAAAQAKVTTAQELLCSFKTRLEHWINAVMDRAEGWTRRNAKVVSLACSLVICLVLNVNAFDLMQGLVRNDTLRAAGMQMASSLVKDNSPATLDQVCASRDDKAQCQFDSALSSLQALPQGAIGWNNRPAFLQHDQKNKTVWFGYWLLGVMTAALAVSLGGDFWFKVLSQMIRLTGSKTVQPPKP
ncbi:hypothetical protein ACN1C3_27325 [Pseudomonas sp. H11T01]|uniref:hypothetical protein n=1 Tax=Pseudomonas sp. H11T01 TaxID=3402749 RepID=UPI003ACB9C7D